MSVELAEVFRRQELAGGQERNRLHRATRNGACLSAVPHSLNGTELSWEKFWDNLRFRYGLMPQDIPATCDGCSKKFSIENAISCPKGGIVIARHDDDAKYWGALGARALTPSAITYEPKINSRTVQGERTGAGAQQEGGEANGYGEAKLIGQLGSGSSNCRVKGRRKLPRLLEAGGHRNV